MLRSLIALLAVTSASALAEAKPVAFVIDNDLGGWMAEYETQRDIMYGSKVIIDGVCLSSCTMFLRSDYALDVCITSRALFGFHMPFSLLDGKPVIDPSAAHRMNILWHAEFYDKFPASMQLLLAGKHIPSAATGDEPAQFYTVAALSLIGIIPLCAEGWAETYQVYDKPTIGIPPQ